MLPGANIENVFYPMTAEIYYAETKQNDFGAMEKTWVFDRKVKCSAISVMSDKTLNSELKSTSSFFQYNSDIAFRLGENIQKKKNGTYYPITEILITNIKDINDNLVWTESEDNVTQYEIATFVPSFDAFNNLQFYRGYLTRSQKQYEVLY
jgi:hypothetical protein